MLFIQPQNPLLWLNAMKSGFWLNDDNNGEQQQKTDELFPSTNYDKKRKSEFLR